MRRGKSYFIFTNQPLQGRRLFIRAGNLALRLLGFEIPRIPADKTVREGNENGNDSRNAEEIDEPAVWQNFQRRHLTVRKAGHDQHLSPIGNEALENRREGAQEGRTAAGIDVELIADALGHFAVDDDGNGIVGRSDVGNRYQGRNPQFEFLPLIKRWTVAKR